MKYTTIIFDLDGTLLNTLEDLKDSVNFALEKFGYSDKTLSEVRSFVGNGAAHLIELCIPNGINNPNFKKCLELFKQHYAENMQNKTKPYDGIISMLEELNKRGYKMAIVSNKFDMAVKHLNKIYFNKFINVAIGERENIKRKPAPDTVLQALKELNSIKEEAIYVGDSDVDIKTANNTGIDCISVSWGFKSKQFLQECHATNIIDKPDEILEILY